jgi:hypothetical protein
MPLFEARSGSFGVIERNPSGVLLSEATMRPCAVVVATPTFDLFAGLTERIECVLVQALVSKLAVEALDVGILGELPGAM